MTRQGVHLGQTREPLRKRLPSGMRIGGRRLSLALGVATAGLRIEPHFILAGAQRSGTTSMFRALMAHPQVVRPTVNKGVNYFDVNYGQPWRWYRGHFPTNFGARLHTRSAGGPRAFEASGYYIYHPTAMARMAKQLPRIKVVVMLRDPVERAYSAWKHEVARGFESESFERAVELEPSRLAGEAERLADDPTYRSFAHRHQSYLHRGHYADQIDRVLAVLPREQVHLIESERFFEQPRDTFLELTGFLDLSPTPPRHFDQYNARPGTMSLDTRRSLESYFATHDQRLAHILGHPPHWSVTRAG